MAESKVGVFNLLMSHLCQQWRRLLSSGSHDDQLLVIESIRRREVVLTEGVVFGPVFKKNLRCVCVCLCHIA